MLLEMRIWSKEHKIGCIIERKLEELQKESNGMISEVRGKGLLSAIVIDESKTNGRTAWDLCLLMKITVFWPNQPMTISSVWLLLWLFPRKIY